MTSLLADGNEVHTKDEDCTVDPETLCCAVCGVEHSSACFLCGARGFHRFGCFRRLGSPNGRTAVHHLTTKPAAPSPSDGVADVVSDPTHMRGGDQRALPPRPLLRETFKEHGTHRCGLDGRPFRYISISDPFEPAMPFDVEIDGITQAAAPNEIFDNTAAEPSAVHAVARLFDALARAEMRATLAEEQARLNAQTIDAQCRDFRAEITGLHRTLHSRNERISKLETLILTERRDLTGRALSRPEVRFALANPKQIEVDGERLDDVIADRNLAAVFEAFGEWIFGGTPVEYREEDHR